MNADKFLFIKTGCLVIFGLIFAGCCPDRKVENTFETKQELHEDAKNGSGQRCFSMPSSRVNERINPYLINGWRVKSVTSIDRAWDDTVIVLEK
jgi:hypothetical protein